jgi:hypothetical protein
MNPYATVLGCDYCRWERLGPPRHLRVRWWLWSWWAAWRYLHHLQRRHGWKPMPLPEGFLFGEEEEWN